MNLLHFLFICCNLMVIRCQSVNPISESKLLLFDSPSYEYENVQTPFGIEFRPLNESSDATTQPSENLHIVTTTVKQTSLGQVTNFKQVFDQPLLNYDLESIQSTQFGIEVKSDQVTQSIEDLKDVTLTTTTRTNPTFLTEGHINFTQFFEQEEPTDNKSELTPFGFEMKSLDTESNNVASLVDQTLLSENLMKSAKVNSDNQMNSTELLEQQALDYKNESTPIDVQLTQSDEELQNVTEFTTFNPTTEGHINFKQFFEQEEPTDNNSELTPFGFEMQSLDTHSVSSFVDQALLSANPEPEITENLKINSVNRTALNEIGMNFTELFQQQSVQFEGELTPYGTEFKPLNKETIQSIENKQINSDNQMNPIEIKQGMLDYSESTPLIEVLQNVTEITATDPTIFNESHINFTQLFEQKEPTDNKSVLTSFGIELKRLDINLNMAGQNQSITDPILDTQVLTEEPVANVIDRQFEGFFKEPQKTCVKELNEFGIEVKEKKDDINYEEINLPSLKQLEFKDDKEYDKNILISDSLKSYYQSTYDKTPIVKDDKDGEINHIMEPIIYNNYISIESVETPENNIITTDDEFIDSYYSTFKEPTAAEEESSNFITKTEQTESNKAERIAEFMDNYYETFKQPNSDEPLSLYSSFDYSNEIAHPIDTQNSDDFQIIGLSEEATQSEEENGKTFSIRDLNNPIELKDSKKESNIIDEKLWTNNDAKTNSIKATFSDVNRQPIIYNYETDVAYNEDRSYIDSEEKEPAHDLNTVDESDYISLNYYETDLAQYYAKNDLDSTEYIAYDEAKSKDYNDKSKDYNDYSKDVPETYDDYGLVLDDYNERDIAVDDNAYEDQSNDLSEDYSPDYNERELPQDDNAYEDQSNDLSEDSNEIIAYEESNVLETDNYNADDKVQLDDDQSLDFYDIETEDYATDDTWQDTKRDKNDYEYKTTEFIYDNPTADYKQPVADYEYKTTKFVYDDPRADYKTEVFVYENPTSEKVVDYSTIKETTKQDEYDSLAYTDYTDQTPNRIIWGAARLNPCIRFYAGFSPTKLARNKFTTPGFRVRLHFRGDWSQQSNDPVDESLPLDSPPCVRKPNWRRLRPITL